MERQDVLDLVKKRLAQFEGRKISEELIEEIAEEMKEQLLQIEESASPIASVVALEDDLLEVTLKPFDQA